MATPNLTATTDRVDARRLPVAAIAAGIAAVIGNLIVYFIANALIGPVQVQMGPGTPALDLPAVPVIMFSFVPALVAGVLLWVLNRFTKRPFTIFLIISGVFLLVSLIPDLTLEVPLGSKLVLILMHIVAAGTIVGVLQSRARAA
jgi:hypothetical protein